jgi:HlyD family secretion protein
MNPSDAQSRLFRKVALERLSTPEQLDVMVQVVTVRSWIALVPFLALVGLALLWGIFGSIPTKVTGKGMLIRTGGLAEVTTASAGRITEMRVKVGDVIKVGQPIAVLAQPDLQDRIKAAKDRMEELARQEGDLQSRIGVSQKLSRGMLDQQRAAIQSQIRSAEDRITVLNERIRAQQALLDQGLITRQTLLNSRNELAAAQLQVEQAKSELQGTSLRGAEDDKRAAQELTQLRNQISETRRGLDTMKSSLDLTTQVISSYEGRIVEVKAGPGTLVAAGNALVTVEPAAGGEGALEAVVYVPAMEGKKVQHGLEVQIVPSTVKREEYGFIMADVKYVSDYAATPESMLSVLQNRQVVSELSGSTSVIEVRASLRPAPTESGYRWSSQDGPPFKVRAGTLGTAEIVVYRQAPITLVIPLLKKSLGLD